METLAVIRPEIADARPAQAGRLFEHRVEHRCEVAGRGIDHLQYLGGRGLLLQGLARLFDESRVLHCDDRLRGKVLQQRSLLVSEWTNYLPVDSEVAKQSVVFAQRDDHPAPHTALFHQCAESGGNADSLLARRICEPNNILAAHYPPRRRGIMSRCPRTIIPGPIGKLRVALCSDEMEALAVPGSEKAKGCFTQPQRLLQHRVEHRGEIAGRRIDDLQYVGGRGLLCERLVTLCSSFIKLDPALGKLALKISYNPLGIG